MRIFPIRLLLPIIGLLLASLACTLTGEQKTIVVTATPNTLEAPPVAPPTVPYVTPTPVIVPTPTLPPDIALSGAQQALKNGDYVTAVDHFQSVIGQSSSAPEMVLAAYYGLGEAALREGLYEQAAVALTEFIKRYPDNPRLPQAHFLRGDAYLGLGQWESAITDFSTYLTLRPGIIDSYAYERIGDSYLALNQPARALENYALAADSQRVLASQFALRERVAASYLNDGRPLDAVAQYDAILAEAQNGPYRASIQYQAAQVLIGAGNVADGYTRLHMIVNEQPDTYQAYQALGILLNAGLEIDVYQQALIYFYNEDYNAAIQAINTYTSQTGTASVDVLLLLGQAYRSMGNAQAAITTFQTIIDTYPTDPAYGQAWLEQGRTLFLGDDIGGAIQRYMELADNHPDVAEAAEALWRAGYLYSTLGDTASALTIFDSLGQRYPGTEQAQEGLMMGATLAYNAGNFGQATQLYSQLAATGSGEKQAIAYLWIGRLYQRDGKDDLARQAFEAAATADPGGYYSLRAQDLLTGQMPFTPPPSYRFDFDEGPQLSEAETWLRNVFGITQEGALYPLSPALASDPRMIRGQELMAVAAYEDAEQEFETLRQAYQNDPLATYQLAIFLRDQNLYYLSITAAANLITSAGVDTLDAPSYIARLRFPIYYSDLVLPQCEANNLDPLLVFALIRQESLFEGFATSYAAAQGLMQIIPDTGSWIANQLGWPDYANSDVYRPYVNVTFGTYYLRWILDQVDNLPYVALAGYNGGPGFAMQWYGISGPDLDLFIQTISYEETQRYVRRIYEQYHVYWALYGAS